MNIDYFIKKFEAIPKNKWCTGIFQDCNNSKCALGHCGYTVDKETKEGKSLCGIFEGGGLNVVRVNDGYDLKFPKKHPKDRILAALKYIKNNTAPLP